MFFGPAVNTAYKLETLAKYPRILIDGFLANKVLEYNKKLNESDSTGTIATINGNIIVKDQDGQYYLNYLNAFQNNPSLEAEVLYENVTELIDKESNKIESLRDTDIKKYTNIAEKYKWIKRYIETLKN